MTLEERYKKKQEELKVMRKELQKKRREEDKKRQAAEEKLLIEKGKNYDDLAARYEDVCAQLHDIEYYMQNTRSGNNNLTLHEVYLIWQQAQQKKRESPEGAQRPAGPQ